MESDEVYLALYETPHGARYYREGIDPSELRAVARSGDGTALIGMLGPYLIGPDGYDDIWTGITAGGAWSAITGRELPGFDPDDDATWSEDEAP
jgi:hypothetical protein